MEKGIKREKVIPFSNININKVKILPISFFGIVIFTLICYFLSGEWDEENFLPWPFIDFSKWLYFIL